MRIFSKSRCRCNRSKRRAAVRTGLPVTVLRFASPRRRLLNRLSRVRPYRDGCGQPRMCSAAASGARRSAECPPFPLAARRTSTSFRTRSTCLRRTSRRNRWPRLRRVTLLSTTARARLAHAKYLPRLFCEHFRKDSQRTFSYEFADEWNKPDDREANFGIVRPRPFTEACLSCAGSAHRTAGGAECARRFPDHAAASSTSRWSAATAPFPSSSGTTLRSTARAKSHDTASRWRRECPRPAN